MAKQKVEVAGHYMLVEVVREHEEGVPGDSRVVKVAAAGPDADYKVGDVLVANGRGDVVPGVGELIPKGHVLAKLT